MAITKPSSIGQHAFVALTYLSASAVGQIVEPAPHLENKDSKWGVDIWQSAEYAPSSYAPFSQTQSIVVMRHNQVAYGAVNVESCMFCVLSDSADCRGLLLASPEMRTVKPWLELGMKRWFIYAVLALASACQRFRTRCSDDYAVCRLGDPFPDVKAEDLPEAYDWRSVSLLICFVCAECACRLADVSKQFCAFSIQSCCTYREHT